MIGDLLEAAAELVIGGRARGHPRGCLISLGVVLVTLLLILICFASKA